MPRYSIIVKGNAQDLYDSVTKHCHVWPESGSVKQFATDCAAVVNTDIEILQEWLAEDLGINPPFPPGSLLYFQIPVEDPVTLEEWERQNESKTWEANR